MATLHAGERATRTEDLYCDGCGGKLHVIEGQDLPRCPSCDNDTFDEIDQEGERGQASHRDEERQGSRSGRRQQGWRAQQSARGQNRGEDGQGNLPNRQ